MNTSEPAGAEPTPSWWQRRRARRAARSRARRIVGRCLTALTVCVALVCVAAGVGVAVLYRQGTRPPGGTGEYVALGSSFAAGPGVGRRAPDSPALCARSDANYAQLLARTRKVSLTDVTCSGATTHDVLDGGQFFQPAQADALRSTTRLVTVTIGGNDVSYLGNLVAWSCGHARDRVPLYWRPMVCSATPQAEVDARLDRLPGQLDRIAQEVHRRAPRARLVFVDYVTVLPDTGSCPDRLPLDASQLIRARYVAQRLAAITVEAARRADADLVSASTATRGHDICSTDPWVSGFTFPATPLSFGAPAYHPTGAAMRAVARAVDAAVSRSTP